jgi:endo-1,4-beta-xylanase
MADAQRVIRLIRNRAEEWQVNAARVGIVGFSAGGEVAALASTRYDAGKTDAADPIERQSSHGHLSGEFHDSERDAGDLHALRG